jgi:hypothetical protein
MSVSSVDSEITVQELRNYDVKSELMQLIQTDKDVKLSLSSHIRDEVKNFQARWTARLQLILSLVLTISDQTTDILTISVYYHNGDIGWFCFGLGLLFIAQVVLGVVMVKLKDRSLPESHTMRFLLGFFNIAPFWIAYSSWGHKNPPFRAESNNDRMNTLKLIETLSESIPQLTLQVYVFGIIQTSEHHLFGQDLIISTASIIMSILSVKHSLWSIPRIKEYNIVIVHILETMFFMGWLGRWAVFGAAYRAYVLVLFSGEIFLLNFIYLCTRCGRCFTKRTMRECLENCALVMIPFRHTRSQILTIIDAVLVTVVMYSFTLPKTGLLSQRVHLCEERVGCFSHQFVWWILVLMGLYVIGNGGLALYKRK